MMLRTMNRRYRAGFSLLEVMLVVVIIGSLMAIVAWNMTGQGNRAKNRVTLANMTMIKRALDQYRLHYNVFPAELGALTAGNMALLSEDNALVDGWRQPFLYQTPGSSGRPYDLISVGPDGQYLTEDDIDVWNMPSE